MAYESLHALWQGLNCPRMQPACRALPEPLLQIMGPLGVWLAHLDFTVHLPLPRTAHHVGQMVQSSAMQLSLENASDAAVS